MSSKTRGGPRRVLPLTASRPSLLTDGTDSELRSLIDDMLAIAAAAHEVRDRFGALIGVSGTQYLILSAIARLGVHQSDLGINGLAEHLRLSSAFVTNEVNRLVSAGLVTKASNPADRRRVVLAVTEEAVRRLSELTRIQAPANDTFFDLTAYEFRMLRTLFARLAQGADRTVLLIEHLAPDGTLDSVR